MYPWIIAHRGAMSEAPENSKASFDRALRYPIDGIELDVQLTRDKIPVVFHDANLKKIINSRRPISFYPYSKLCQMDWGSWFADAFAREKLLTLEQVLLEYGQKTRLLVEIKLVPSPDDNSDGGYLSRIVPEMIQTLVPPEFVDQMMILSFNAAVVATAMSWAPHLNYGLNLQTNKSGILERPGRLAAASLPIHKIEEGFVKNCHAKGLIVMTYACNTAYQVDKALNLGVDVIMTDDPAGICSYLNR